jgi:hypothetical protein
LLPYLRADVIEQVAYKNALRVFKLDAQWGKILI